MGLLDKVKIQATQAAHKAQEAGKAGQAKLEEAQAKRKMDALYRDLGAAVYAERSGAPGAGPDEVERLIDQIKAFEKEDAEAATAAGSEEAAGTTAAGGGEEEPSGEGSPAGEGSPEEEPSAPQG